MPSHWGIVAWSLEWLLQGVVVRSGEQQVPEPLLVHCPSHIPGSSQDSATYSGQASLPPLL